MTGSKSKQNGNLTKISANKCEPESDEILESAKESRN